MKISQEQIKSLLKAMNYLPQDGVNSSVGLRLLKRKKNTLVLAEIQSLYTLPSNHISAQAYQCLCSKRN